jgi:hypothetical protein
MNDIIKRDVFIKLHDFIHFHIQYLKNPKCPVRSRSELKIWHKYTIRRYSMRTDWDNSALVQRVTKRGPKEVREIIFVFQF